MDLYLLQPPDTDRIQQEIFSSFSDLKINIITSFSKLEEIKCIQKNSIFILYDDFKHRYESYAFLMEKNILALIIISELESRITSFQKNNVHLLASPVNAKKLHDLIKSILEAEKQALDPDEEIIWGKSKAMKEIRELLHQFSKNKQPVLIAGPIGSGKTFFARYLAKLSANGNEVIEVNSATINESLGEDLLFGHTIGAYTNCKDKRAGLCKLAENSVLFMDEFHTLPLSIQPKLLRVLETGKFRPIGSDKEITTNFKLVAASSATRKELEEKLLPELLARIGPYRLEIPSLKERIKDMILFIDKMEKEMMNTYGKKGKLITDMGPWLRYEWPGNIRELTKNVFFFFETGRLPYTLKENEEKYKLEHPDEINEKGRLKRVRKRNTRQRR